MSPRLCYTVALPHLPTSTDHHCYFFQILLLDESHRTFFMETGKQMITGIMMKANKVKHIFMLSLTNGSLWPKINCLNYLLLCIRVPRPFWRAMRTCCCILRERKHGQSLRWSWMAVGWAIIVPFLTNQSLYKWCTKFVLYNKWLLFDCHALNATQPSCGCSSKKVASDFYRNPNATGSKKVFCKCPPLGGVYELLWHCVGLYPDGCLWRPRKPSVVCGGSFEEPLAVRQL